MKRLAVLLIGLFVLSGCPYASDSLGSGGEDTYALQIQVTYDSDDAVVPYEVGEFIYLFIGDSKGSLDDFRTTEQQGYGMSSYEYTFPQVTFSPCYVIAYYDDDDSGTLSSGDPYEIYEDTGVLAEALAITLDADAETEITIEFDSTNRWP